MFPLTTLQRHYQYTLPKEKCEETCPTECVKGASQYFNEMQYI